ncbi:MAG: hypothetical protein KKA81_14380, partial [Bacteroidetes bacterium]|nr:hypothetical protein [Bacteroidota bacterium]
MAGYKETPRQKMIAMLYLVLTALLALNVSKDILDAFLVVNEGMEDTNVTIKTKIDNTYEQFEFQYNLNKNKVGPYWERALEARTLSNDMIKYIDKIKFEIVQYSERTDSITTIQEFYRVEQVPDPLNPGKTIDKLVLDLESVKGKDKYDRTTNYFINQGKANELKKRLEQYKDEMRMLVDSNYRDLLNLGLETDGIYYDASGQRESWEMHNFYYTILAAEVTILNKLIA